MSGRPTTLAKMCSIHPEHTVRYTVSDDAMSSTGSSISNVINEPEYQLLVMCKEAKTVKSQLIL